MVQSDVALQVLVQGLKSRDFTFIVVNGITLGNCLFGQLLVFQMNLLLYLLDVSLCLLAGLLFEVFNLFVKVRFNLALFAGKLDLVLVLCLPDLVSQLLTRELPLVYLCFINLLLPLELLHAQNVLLELTNRDFTLCQLILPLSFHRIQISLHFTSLLIGTFLLLFLKFKDFVAQLKLFTHFGSIFYGQFLDNVLFFLDLGFELLNQSVVLSSPDISYMIRSKTLTYFLVMATSLSLIEFFKDGKSLTKR